ncbi:hypothetical protein ACFLQN_03770 [Candidatus Aenigmatarchaeota archaeon]
MVAMFLELLYVVFFYLAASFLIITFTRYYRGMNIPIFWAYFLGGFFLLTVESFFALILKPTELYLTYVAFVKLVGSVLVFLGSFELYKNLNKK